MRKNKNLELVTDEIQNLKKLIAGRVDLVTYNKVEMAWRLKKPLSSG
ncbi:MAG: hypothetical protein GY749_37960 [Desulfobacteraceae bacterium]|nr:hypothetical protein [Desulfobacteraceae bacterium]